LRTAQLLECALPTILQKHKQYLKLRTAQLLECALTTILQKYEKKKGEKVNMFWTKDISTPKYRVVATPTALSSQSLSNNLNFLTNEQ
jgi:hypothetical protein